MSFSVSCQSCGHTFPELDDSLRGQQAHCPCGEIVTLDNRGADRKRSVKRQSSQSSPTSQAVQRAKSKPSRQRESTRSRRSGQRPSPRPPGPGRSRLKSHPTPHTDAKPKPDAAPLHPASVHTDPPTKAKSHPVETTHAIEVTRTEDEQAPLIDDTFSDLDSILAAGADHRPLGTTRAPTTSPGQRPPGSGRSNQPQVAAQRRPIATRQSTPDHANPALTSASPEDQKSIASLWGTLGAVMALVAGLSVSTLATVARFSVLGETPFGWIAKPLNGLYLGYFDSSAVEGTNRMLMLSVGWCLTVVMALLIIAIFVMFIRLAVYLLAGVQILGWSRWGVMGLTVAALFLGVAWWMTFASYQQQLMQRFENQNPAAFGMLEEPESTKQLRLAYAEESQSITTALLVLGGGVLVTLIGVGLALGLEEQGDSKG